MTITTEQGAEMDPMDTKGNECLKDLIEALQDGEVLSVPLEGKAISDGQETE